MPDAAGGEPRFVMLETIREYAWSGWRRAGKAMPSGGGTRRYFLALAEETPSHG